MGFIIPTLPTIKTKDEARQLAINWQIWVSERNLSYGELGEFRTYFSQIAKKFKLTEEFKENGII